MTSDGGSEARSARRRVDLRDPVEAEYARRVALAWREMRRGAAGGVIRNHMNGTGADALEQGQVDALDVLLSRRDGWRMSELATALRVDPSTVTRTVQRLVDDGLAERLASDDDGRVVMVVVSAEGRRRHRAVAKRRAAVLGRVMAEFEPDERPQLAELFNRFVSAMDLVVSELGEAETGGDRSDPGR